MQGWYGQGDIAILPAFGQLDVKEHTVAVNLIDFEVGSLAEAEAAGIDESQAGAVTENPDIFQHGSDLSFG